jgi:hypothetical protein
MNLFPQLNEKDDKYNTYLSQYKTASKYINAASTSKSNTEQVRIIAEKIPYFEHTTPSLMAIAMHLALSNGATLNNFDENTASTLLDTVYSSLKTSKDKKMLIIDVARYYTRLLSP